jgi:hypothetical protein
MPSAKKISSMKKKLNYQVELNLLILCLFILEGCTVIHSRIDSPLQFNKNDFNEGQTQISTVLNDLGPPVKISALGNGVGFLYEDVLITERQIGVSFGQGISSLIKFSYAKAKANRKTLLLLFNDKGILTSYEFQDVTEKVGSGIGVSFLFSIVSLVDTSYLEEEPAAFQWGATLLKPLPETLNGNQSLDSGQNGLELRGTTKDVGQRSLEMRSTGKQKR